MDEFCKRLPKIELHAHLNGSLSNSTLNALRELKIENNSIDQKDEKYIIKDEQSRDLNEAFAVFAIAHALTDTPQALKIAVQSTLREFHNDGVIYLELRSTPRGNDHMTKSEYVQAMIDGITEISNEISMKTCLLLSIDRSKLKDDALDTVELAILMATEYPDIVIGLDLSGNPIINDFDDFADILQKGRDSGLKVTLHGGEVFAERETMDMIKWRPDRFGHMTCSIMKYSEATWKATLESKIPIELCLTSNLKCRCITAYEDHHFKEFYKAGHPISIATDDKGVFETELSREFLICATTFNLNKNDLWNISLKTVDQIFAGDDVKDNLRQQLFKFKSSDAF